MDELQILMENNKFKDNIQNIVNEVISTIKNNELEFINSNKMNNELTNNDNLIKSQKRNNLNSNQNLSKLSDEIRELKKIYLDLLETQTIKYTKNYNNNNIVELKNTHNELLKENSIYENAILNIKKSNSSTDLLKNTQNEIFLLDSNISNFKRLNHDLRSKISISNRYLLNILNKLSCIDDDIRKYENLKNSKLNGVSCDYRKTIECIKKSDLKILENEKYLNQLELQEKELQNEIDSLIIENKKIDRFIQISDKSNINTKDIKDLKENISKNNSVKKNASNSKLKNKSQRFKNENIVYCNDIENLSIKIVDDISKKSNNDNLNFIESLNNDQININKISYDLELDCYNIEDELNDELEVRNCISKLSDFYSDLDIKTKSKSIENIDKKSGNKLNNKTCSLANIYTMSNSNNVIIEENINSSIAKINEISKFLLLRK